MEMVEGLEQRGATVTRVPVYRWALPEDLGPLRPAIGGGSEESEHRSFHRRLSKSSTYSRSPPPKRARWISARLSRPCTIVGSIGPTTSETLRAHNLPVDIEPEHPKLGHLIAAVAAG